MKYKLYVFSFMFLIWCVINILSTLILRLACPDQGGDFYFSSFHLVNFYAAFILSALAVVSVRYLYLAISAIAVCMALCLIPGLMQGDITGNNGAFQMEKMPNSIFVHNEFLLIASMYLFYIRLSLNLTCQSS